MTITQTTSNGITVLAPSGRIDTNTSATLDAAVREVVDAGARALVVDFAGVEYISSAGLRVLLVLAKRMRELQGRLVLCGMGQPVRQVFQLAGFVPLFTIVDSRDTALTRLASQP